MRYEVKASAIEAERVLLEGHNLFAVSVEGKAHLIPGDVFELFFMLGAGLKAMKPEKVEPVKRTALWAAKRALAAERAIVELGAKPKPSGVPAESLEPLSTNPAVRSKQMRQIVLDAIGRAPQSTDDIGNLLYPESPNAKLKYQGAWLQLKNAAADGQVEKRDGKWHLK